MFRLYTVFVAVCSFCFCSLGSARLVGLPAPDFEAEAVFEKKFIDVKLSDYRFATANSSTSKTVSPAHMHVEMGAVLMPLRRRCSVTELPVHLLDHTTCACENEVSVFA